VSQYATCIETHVIHENAINVLKRFQTFSRFTVYYLFVMAACGVHLSYCIESTAVNRIEPIISGKLKCAVGGQRSRGSELIKSVDVGPYTGRGLVETRDVRIYILHYRSNRLSRSFLPQHLQPLLRSSPPEITEFGEITQNKGHYAVQDHSRSPVLVPIETSCAISY